MHVAGIVFVQRGKIKIALCYKFSQKLLTNFKKDGMLNPKTKERGRVKCWPLSTCSLTLSAAAMTYFATRASHTAQKMSRANIKIKEVPVCFTAAVCHPSFVESMMKEVV